MAQEKTYDWGLGRRKCAVARVRIRAGAGAIRINDREPSDYFVRSQDREVIVAPLHLLQAAEKYDVWANVAGGGYAGQAVAVQLGLARALAKVQPESEVALRNAGFLTRDSRIVERKKYGQRGARASFQFSKR